MWVNFIFCIFTENHMEVICLTFIVFSNGSWLPQVVSNPCNPDIVKHQEIWVLDILQIIPKVHDFCTHSAISLVVKDLCSLPWDFLVFSIWIVLLMEMAFFFINMMSPLFYVVYQLFD